MRARAGQLAAVLGDESGIAIAIALAVLLIGMLLTGVAAGIAIQTKQFTGRDSNTKAAIEAANAGLRTAVYRLNTYQPGPGFCPTPTATAVGGSGAPSGSLCPPDGPDVPQGLGNGATFSYWVSRAMESGDGCTGPNVSSNQSDVAQRCITSVGTAGGVSARVQERIASYTSTPAFPTAIFGTRNVVISNNVTITSDTPGTPALLGTNGSITIGGQGGGTTTIDGFQLPPGVVPQLGNNVVDLGPTTGISSPYPTPTPIYPFSTAQNTASPYANAGTVPQAGTCSQTEAQSLGWSGTWLQTNCDYEVGQGITYPGCMSGGTAVRDCDQSVGLVSADFGYPTNRTLYLPNNTSLVLAGGYYNFCSLFLDNNSHITVLGGQATIFIDGNEPGSGCPTTSYTMGGNTIAPGTFRMNQNSSFNAGGSALNAQILVYGDQTNVPPTNNVVLNNNGSSSFALLAPFSNVSMQPSNNSTFRGAIVGYSVSLGQASHFTYEADTQSFGTTSIPIYYPSYWEQCPRQQSSSPTAGC
jgi:hypothetical protein